MALFNLTQLGFQNYIQATKYEVEPAHQNYEQKDDKKGNGNNPPAEPDVNHSHMAGKEVDLACGSHRRYKVILQKHKRNQKAPNEIYRTPVTSSQTYGWWSKTENIRDSEQWTRVSSSYPRVNSEVTKFVDKMSLTNRDFTLF
ncbi:PREDICTED: uncharacterized protein LOC106815578 [Priapulus caudatus]|uniref:Uncharacterized protein LOC106815578 n=1 Tax=Priapulus caudatus TaxID=37621 RepID=A0ABM1ETL4_PRICU|nr:PREDICTED: uncharacterized protein LOC106815578 [Priapulus caudatus]